MMCLWGEKETRKWFVIKAAGRKHRDGSCGHLTKELLLKIRKFIRIDCEIHFPAEPCRVFFMFTASRLAQLRHILRQTSDQPESTYKTCKKNCKMRRIPNGYTVKCYRANFITNQKDSLHIRKFQSLVVVPTTRYN